MVTGVGGASTFYVFPTSTISTVFGPFSRSVSQYVPAVCLGETTESSCGLVPVAWAGARRGVAAEVVSVQALNARTTDAPSKWL